MSDPAARDRIRLLLRAAARLLEPGDPLRHEALRLLPAETGLPERHVARALDLCLETSASDDDLAALCASVAPAPRTHVLLAASVFVAPLRALALGWASSSRVLVRASRRATVVPSLLLRALREQGVSREQIDEVEQLAPAPGDHVHAYGSDETLVSVEASLPPGAFFWKHGHGFGLAALDLPARDDQLAGLARDAVLFDQRGCLSPRLLLVVADEERGAEVARALHLHMEAMDGELPVGERDPVEIAAARFFAETLSATGDVARGATAVVGHQHDPAALLVPTCPRGMLVVSVPDVARARALVAPLASRVTILGGSGAMATGLATGMPRARRAQLGEMQHPPLDGPVDRREPAPR